MRNPEMLVDDISLYIDESESTLSLSKEELNQKSSLPDSEHIYVEIVKKKFNDDKQALKRASWSPAEQQEYGLPPTGKRIDVDHLNTTKSSNRVRMRSRPTRSYQLQQPNSVSTIRPLSLNENLQNGHGISLSNQRREPSPALDNRDFLSDTSSVTTTISPRICSPTTIRPLLGTYQQKDSDYKIATPLITCSKGQKELLLLSSPPPLTPFESSLNQYPELTSQTASIDLSPDDRCHPTTRRLMTTSLSPNHRHHHQQQTNIIDGLKLVSDQTDSAIISGGCLKTNKSNRSKKSVHFDCRSPTEIRSSSCHYHRPSVTVTSSSSRNIHDQERERTRRTMMTKNMTSPLATHLIHRSFSLSPSPLSKEENNSNRRQRQQVKKEYVDELNANTTPPVTCNDTISPRKKGNASEHSTPPMSLNTFLVQTSSTKKCPSSNGFFNLIHRSNSKPSSTQRKSRPSANKRFSADVESLSNGDTNKVNINHQQEFHPTRDNHINNTDCYNQLNRSSILMSTRTIKSNEDDSINNGLLFRPVQSLRKEPFYLSVPKSPDDSSIGTMMQTSTLIISTPPQYHYYLYPPSISKKNSTTNISMNSISTNSTSSSSSSYDLDEDTLSYSTYSVINQNKTAPVVLSDSVQNFWPPPPSPATLNNDPEQTIMASTVEQNKQSQSNLLRQKTCQSSTSYDESLPMSNRKNQRDVLPPPASLMLNNKEEEEEEVRTYSEQSSFSNRSLRLESENSLEDSQASYSERLREKARSINRPVAMNVSSYSLSRSRSKDHLNQPPSQQSDQVNVPNRTLFRPKSAGQVLLSPVRQEISNDFQSKRQFFENRTSTDSTPSSSTNNRIYTHSPVNHIPRHVTKCSWNDLSSRQLAPPPPSQPESMIRTTKYVDSLSNQFTLPPTVHRKPVRIVRAVQRSAPTSPNNDLKSSSPIKMNLSSQYIRNLFPIPDRRKRHRSRENSESHDLRPTEDLIIHLKTRLAIWTDQQRIINDEIESNTILGSQLMKIIESQAEVNEIEKLKLHINEIETITSVLLKLSCRLAKVENDLSAITDDNAHTKTNLLEQRDKIQQKHDEAKSLKDGIDRRSRLVTTILRKYLSDEQFDDYEHFIRMKSTLLMDAKDIEENLVFLQKQIEILLHRFEQSSSVHPIDYLPTEYSKSISTTA